MDTQEYKVVMTGELLPGFSEHAATQAMAEIFQTSADSLRLIFAGGQHPINERFSADEALDLQIRLEQVGVRCKIERLPTKTIDVRIRRDTIPSASTTAPSENSRVSNQAGMMKCPACGHEQLVSQACSACGVIYAEYHAQKQSVDKQVKPQVTPSFNQPSTEARSTSASTHAQDNWHEAWGGFDEIEEPGEHFHLSLFFGEKADYYLKACERYMKGTRTRLALGWNWAAIFSPFIWAMYRKMWGWGLLIFVTEIFIPAMLITLGINDPLSNQLVYIGIFLLVLNRVVWPTLANYLYCRYARSSVQQLHTMAPNYAAEIDIATAGGVSGVSVLVGIALAGVMSVLLFSIMASVEDSERFVQEQRVFKESGKSELTNFEGRAEVNDVTGLGSVSKKHVAPKNKWVSTRKILRTLGQKVNNWISENPSVTDASQINLYKLRQEMSINANELQDGWGNEIQYIPDIEGYRLISSGPDRLFGTADDIQYRQVMAK